MRWSILAAAASLFLASAAQAQAPVEPVPGWLVEGEGRDGHVKAAPHLGREALWLRGGTHAVRKGVDMADGTIEFDVAPMAGADFVAITFRRRSLSQHENVYFRIRRSGDFMAVQYAPRMGSSTWQLYPEFLAVADWPHDRWTHVRLEARGSRLEVYVGEAKTPTVVVPRMRHGSRSGEVGVWARVNNRPEAWAAAISNFQVRPAPDAAPLAAPAPPPKAFIRRWQVAGPFPESAAGAPPSGATWQAFEAEESGLVNLSRVFAQQPNRRLTAFARRTIVSDAARTVRLGVGYSDQVEVWLNGTPVYGAVNGFNSRHPGYTGFVDTRFEHAWLPLKAGRNDLLLAVTDDQAFGWGFAARLESLQGLTLEP